MPIQTLAYAGLRTTSLQAWRDIANSVLAFETVNHDHGDAGALYLRMDSFHHRLAIYPAESDQMAYLGWQVEDSAALDECANRLRAAGIQVTEAAPAIAAERAVRQMIAFEDFEGFRHEICWGPSGTGLPFNSPFANAGYVTGSQGMGHAVLCASDPARLIKMFQTLFGFRLSDTITVRETELVFLRCNSRHHSLAIMSPGLGVAAGEMHHLLFELRDLDDLGRAHDAAQEMGLPFLLGLGRHINDRMLSFYFKSPSNIGIELGWGASHIDDQEAWIPMHFKRAGIWGHKPGGR